MKPQAAGRVLLVGAGPGDPDLLTVAAYRTLQDATHVFHDDLVADAILKIISPKAAVVNVGKRGYRPSCKQPEINRQIVEAALAGHEVVRLKAGDPLIFGRAGEELSACTAAGVDVTVIPGITSAQGAAARILASLTHRDYARRLQFITAHDRHGKLPEDMNWAAVADPKATTVVYMPHKTLPELSARLIAHGLPDDTPCVAVMAATRAEERVLRSSVARIADDVQLAGLRSPLIVLIGAALRTL